MADYYPLIARAVAGLEKNTGEARRALYERARGALVAQLRSVNPPLSENDVTRERLALEESIRKVEAEAARKSWVDPANGAAPSRVRAPEFPRWDPPPASAPDDTQPRAASVARGDQPGARPATAPRALRGGTGGAAAAAAAANGMLGEQRYADPVFDQPLSSDQAPGVSARPAAPRAKADRHSLLDTGLKEFRGGVPVSGDDPLPRVVVKGPREGPRENGGAPQYPTAHEYDRLETRAHEPHAADGVDHGARPLPEQGESYDESRSMPVKERQRGAKERTARRSFRDIARIGLMLVALACLGGVMVWLWPSMTSLYRSVSAPAPPMTVAGDSQPTSSRSTKITDRLEQGATPAATPTALTAAPSGSPGSAASVAQKVVLYEEDPAEPQGRRFVGSAIWRIERVPPAPGQPEEVAIRADVEIPDRKLAMTWSLRRNTDQSLPASHTVEILFRLPQDFPPGAVVNVPGILMKRDEQTRGSPLAGHAVKVTDSYYLIGLSSFDTDRESNLRMLKERGWLDIPVIYSNKRRAILAVEKGTPGERVFAEAFAAWRQ
ncbi:MAG: hypothetical protein IT536_07285 [Hyphomicrobiales bacterium]|nr:hypothetical protein [Hyphomicrobiales bacterium]